jgi:hypothetical protein
VLRSICSEVGFDLAHADAALLQRMELLAEYSETVSDAKRMVGAAQAIFRHYETAKPSVAFSASERRTVVLGCLFSDIGKTGPAAADENGRRLIVEMFAVERVSDDKQSVASFLQTYFPDDAEERVARFTALGLDPAMSVRQFWNLHGGWTLAITEAAGVPLEVVAAAGTHHLLEDVNPDAIVTEDGRFSRDFGGNTAFDRAEKLVIVLDKYDAVRRRGRRTHDEAIEWLRELIAKNPRFQGDRVFETLIEDVRVVLDRQPV